MPGPAPSAEQAPFSVVWVGSSLSRSWEAEGCSGDRCTSTVSDTHTALRVGVRPVEPLALWVEGRYSKIEVGGSGHAGRGPGAAAGASLVWPGHALRPAFSAQYSVQRSESLNQGDAVSELRSSSQHWELDLSPQLVWGSGAQGATVWVGPSISRYGSMDLSLKIDDVDLVLAPKKWAGVLIGAELRSDPLGMPGRRKSYLAAGAQLQALDGFGFSAWMGLHF